MTHLLPILLITLLHFTVAKAIDYCNSSLSCNGIQNSGCNCEYGASCQDPRLVELTQDIRKFIAATHNTYREKVASGSENRGGINAPATNMFALRYDANLEQTAICWNKKCTFSHDKCRSTPDFQPAGQNLFYSSGKPCEWKESLKEALYLWYEEVEDMTNDCLRAYGSGCATAKVGHFAQLMWAKTTHVGCSLIEYKRNMCQIVCNYGPAGNYQGERVFIQGEAGSDCKFRSRTYKHLCSRRDERIKNIKEKSAENGTDLTSNVTSLKSYGLKLRIPKLLLVYVVILQTLCVYSMFNSQ